MESPKQTKKHELTAEILFYLLVFAAMTGFAAIQAFGHPPDEISHFKVVSYICRHGTLPHGADPEILLDGYGGSYAFQPILTYIIQGFLLRFLRLFTTDNYVLLLAARMVNVCFGVLTAYFVRQTAKELWKSPYLQWLFTMTIIFLPQHIFIHSYVNTDSMAMLSVSIICYTLFRARRTSHEKRDCILPAVGIILCALSYYNAYGIIPASLIIFCSRYVHIEGKNAAPTGSAQKQGLWIEWDPLLRKGLFISVIVLLGIGWWFIRNGILYHGDIIALNARRECMIQAALPEFNPLTRTTFSNSGYSLSDMLFGAFYIRLVRDSFIAMFGAMDIPTHGLIYVYYKRLWIATCSVALLMPELLWRPKTDSPWSGRRKSLPESGRTEKLIFYGCMLLFSLITIGLSIFYSYIWDFQPQGRYILPVLIPFIYLVTLGVQKTCGFLQNIFLLSEKSAVAKNLRFFSEKTGIILGRLLCLGIILYVLVAFAYSFFHSFLGYYNQNANLFLLHGEQVLNIL